MFTMIIRKFWLKKIEELFKNRNIIWLYGVRRVGKTFLCKSIPEIIYYDCELPYVRKEIQSEYFLDNLKNKIVAIDEIHKIDNPAEILKIAADYYKDVKIIATGSSTLSSYKKFKDTLTGRKYNLKLLPINSFDMEDFNNNNLRDRMQRGGLPQFFMSEVFNLKDYAEWFDSYWAKDVSEIFRIEKKDAFMKFIELLFSRSGGIFEATKYATECEVSRHTIKSYLYALEQTSIINIIRPFSRLKSKEIVSAPKIYSFDTGFTYFFKGWKELREDDLGLLWEELVLNEIISIIEDKPYYWRDKFGHEIDFVLPQRGGKIIAIECKWNSLKAEFNNIEIFRKIYPEGKNILVCGDCRKPYMIKNKKIKIDIIGFKHIIDYIK